MTSTSSTHPPSAFKSQWKQDEYVYQQFFADRKEPGFFVDIGAHNGVTGSNSYFFEKELHWQGICVEPMLDQYVKLVENRSCFCMNCCVYNKVGFVEFTENSGYTEMLSGITETYNGQHLNRIKSEQFFYGGQLRQLSKQTYPLSKILDLHDVKTVDYLSVDTEGSEYQVLSSLDFSRVRVNVLTVENNYPYEFHRIDKLLTDNGMVHCGKVVGDEVYTHRDFRPTSKQTVPAAQGPNALFGTSST